MSDGGSTTSGGSRSDAGTAATGTSASGDGGTGARGEAGTTARGGEETDLPGGAPSDGGEGAGGAAVAGGGGIAAPDGSAGASAGAGGSGGSGGSSGSGGAAPVATCDEHPITPKAMWMATASSESLGTGVESDGLYNPAAHMTDGRYDERWSSGKTQAGDEWIQIDFGAVVSLTTFTLNVNTDPGDYPRAYELRVSPAPEDFTAAVRASGEGMPGNTVMNFPLVSGRYVTVRQTAMNTENAAWWTVAEVFAACVTP